MLEVRLLGELAVFHDGQPAVLPRSRKTRALLAYLILNPGPHRRDKLCALFWQVPDDPRGSLRWSLSKLRGLVDESGSIRIKADRERVEFRPLGASVDLLAARARLADGPGRVDSDELSGLAEALAAGCLEGMDIAGQSDFHLFLSSEREKVRAMRALVLRELLERSSNAPAEAVRRLQALVELEPYEVELHRRLIEALAKAGRRQAAERQRTMSESALPDLTTADRMALQRAAHSRPVPTRALEREPAETLHRQQIRFCRAADGVQIAWASLGDGPPLVKAANWLNHLEFDWESPVWRHVFRALAAGRRLIRYDARGNGLSDWNTEDYDLDRLVSDLEAVVDAAGLDRFPLLALSQGCAVSVEYAARHPERVSKLVLIGGYARGWCHVESSDIARQTEAMIVLVRLGWGKDNPAFRQMFTSMFMPDAPLENQSWFNELQRRTTTPENAVRLMRACGNVDLRSRLADVKAPTLVLHARNDMRIPFESGREMAAGIPGARFVTLDTRNHLMPEGDPAWPHLMSEIDAFLADQENLTPA